jgi:hypothetical protein
VTERKFNDAEVDAILRDAIDRQVKRGDGTLSRTDLHELARQLKVDPTHIDAAIASLDTKRGEQDAVAEIKARRRRGFRTHAMVFVLVGLFLVALNAVVPGPWTVQVPLLVWALGVAFHAWGAFGEPSPRAVTRHLERKRREEEKARRREQREAMKRDAAVIGHAVEDGLREVLGEVRRAIEEESAKPSERVNTAQTGVRVDVSSEDRDEVEVGRAPNASRAERKR